VIKGNHAAEDRPFPNRKANAVPVLKTKGRFRVRETEVLGRGPDRDDVALVAHHSQGAA
jgi:hypothetical protein